MDALLGTGLRGPVEGLLASAIADTNAARASRGGVTVVAVDFPSGLGSDAQDFGGPAIAADYTVTLTAPKVGQLVSPRASNCGVLVVRSIGTPPELFESDPRLKLHWLEPGEFRALPLARAPDSNKGTYGHALIVAGSRGKSGAAILAARGTLRSGAGLVTVATPMDVQPVVAAGMPEMMTAPLDGHRRGHNRAFAISMPAALRKSRVASRCWPLVRDSRCRPRRSSSSDPWSRRPTFRSLSTRTASMLTLARRISSEASCARSGADATPW